MDLVRLVRSRLQFMCPACDTIHEVVVLPEGMVTPWGWNQSLTSPTITPSIKVTSREWLSEESYREKVCHSFVTEGRIHYCTDSTHVMRGQIVGIPAISVEPARATTTIEST